MEKMEGMKGYNKQSELRDTYRIAYIIHFFLGAGNLLPWNAFITAVDYFSYLYPGNHVEKVFSIAYMSSSVLVLVLMTSWGNGSRRLTFRLTMNIGLSMFVLSLMVTPMIDWIWCSDVAQKRAHGSYMMTVASVVACGLADGLIGGSLIGAAGNLPKEYMQAVFAGTASSGVLVCILRIITKASLPQNTRGLRTSAHVYFIVSIIILMCCILCSNLLFMLPAMQQHYKLPKDYPHSSIPKFWNTTRKISWPAFGIFLTYVITLSIFPGFIADDQQSKLIKDWYPILLISVYNVSDLVGKCLTAVYLPSNIGKATWACLARLLLYPLFAACLHGPKWLRTEVPMVLLTFMLGISNGYLTSVLMILTPKSVPNLEAEAAAVVMAVFLGLGLLGGSVFGWLWII
ncbi:Equilibrative nucleotide transporter 8 [Ancistrocladus abbreviatus]